MTDATFQQLSLNVEFFEYEISNAADIAVTITQKVEEYEKAVTPPLTRALINFAKEGKYTFCTPGHMSGTAFQHSPVGALFYDFFGAAATSLRTARRPPIRSSVCTPLRPAALC